MIEQQTRPWWHYGILFVPLLVIAGSASGIGFGPDDWYKSLDKPTFQPPNYLFGIVWPILYAMQGFAVSLILAQPATPARRSALVLFALQFALNLTWSYAFFGAHAIEWAKWHLAAMLVLAALAAGRFYRIRPLAGWLMVPYLLWLIFAFTLNSAIVELNPGVSEPLFG